VKVNSEGRSPSFWTRCFHVATVAILCLCSSAVTLRGQSIYVSPLILRTSLLPGESTMKIVSIKNNTDRNLLFTVAKKDWDAMDDGQVEVLDPGTIASSLCDWFILEEEEFEVKAGASEELELCYGCTTCGFSS